MNSQASVPQCSVPKRHLESRDVLPGDPVGAEVVTNGQLVRAGEMPEPCDTDPEDDEGEQRGPAGDLLPAVGAAGHQSAETDESRNDARANHRRPSRQRPAKGHRARLVARLADHGRDAPRSWPALRKTILPL